MSCDKRIDSFFKKADKLKADLSYAMYKESQFGNTEQAAKYSQDLKNVDSLSWLLKKHECSTCDCNQNACLCSGATPNWESEQETYIDTTFDPGPTASFNEGFKGIVVNTKTGKNVSLTTFTTVDYTFVHTGIRLYEWDGDVSTKIYEQDGIINIDQGDHTSFYYSEAQDAYYIRTQETVPSVIPAKVFRLSGDFTSLIAVDKSFDPNVVVTNVVMEVVDELGLLMVKIDDTTIEALSLVDLTVFKTIDTTGFPYQKMTWDKNNCALMLTGGGGVGDAPPSWDKNLG